MEIRKELKAMCYQTSGTLPVYYYLRSPQIDQGIDFLLSVNKNSQAKSKLISRLGDNSSIQNAQNSCSIYSSTAIGAIRLELFEKNDQGGGN